MRALVELAGWLTPVPAADVPDAVLDFADACPCEALFDVGLTAALLQLDVAEVVLHESHAVENVEPEDFAAAAPDPVTVAEADLLAAEGDSLAGLCVRVAAWAGRGTASSCSGWTGSASASGWSRRGVATTCGSPSPSR